MARSRAPLVVATLLLTVCIAACDWFGGKLTPTPGPVEGTEVNTTEPRWVEQDDPRAQVAVVFIHGIFGDTIGTWTDADSGTSFFDLLKNNPSVGGKLDLFAFGYTSTMLAGSQSSFSVQEAANRLNQQLRFHGVLDYPSIVFVAHSMGGLVTLRHLLTYRDVLDKVPLIAFYATPQEGAQIAAIAQIASGNPALRDMLPADYNNFLQVLNDDWREATREGGPTIVCGYEKRPTAGIDVVRWSSATRFCSGASVPIDADHITIVKPNSPGHESIVLLVNALNEFVVGDAALPRLAFEDFTREGDRWVYTLSTAVAQPARLRNAGRLPLSYEIADLAPNGLHTWPWANTRRTIHGGQRDDLLLGLAFGAQASEYRFTVKSSADRDQTVVVRVPDLASVHTEQSELALRVTENINEYLAAEGVTEELAALPPNTIPQPLLDRARATVDAALGDAPESLRWVITAEALRTATFATFAAGALRSAERSSPEIVQAPSVLRVAALTAASSGERVFATIDNPAPTDAAADTPSLLQAGLSPEVADQLATRLKAVPALSASGFALEGDLQRFRGDNEAARRSYQNAQQVRPTPEISNRLSTLPAGAFNVAPEAANRPEQIDRATELARPGVQINEQAIQRAGQIAQPQR